jgi:molybdate/tungstate transport system substrate-binding protein
MKLTMPASLRARFALLSLFLLATLAACSSKATTGSGGPSGSPAGSPSAAATGSGPVKVLYAGSLANLITNQVGPGFTGATGYRFQGTPGDSGGLANGIISGVYAGSDVFVSASPAKNTPLLHATPPLETWYATWATSPVVLAFQSGSKVSATLSSGMPWYQVTVSGSYKVGRTNPASDPTAVLADQAITETATAEKLPALNAYVATTSNQYAETALPVDIQAGQLDAGFMYQVEAKSYGLAYVPLTVPGLDLSSLHASYTISILKAAPDEAGAEAFVNYLLGRPGQAFLTTDAFTIVTPPSVTGTGVPAGVSSVIGG